MSTRVEIKNSTNSDGDTMYSPVYYYEVNGTEYSCSSSMSSNIRPSLDNKEVKYNSNEPSECVSNYTKTGNLILIIFLLSLLIFIAIGVSGFIKINKRIKKIEELNFKGKLIKNLPYRMEDTNMSVNNVPIRRPVVEYTLSTGSVVMLEGDQRNDRKFADADGFVDIVIDENDLSNYYIDFEINRLTGNLPGDYYVNPNMNINQQTMNTEYQQQPQQNINN